MRAEQHAYFMAIAAKVAKRSACLSRQVGCILVDDRNHILSTGYNGPPSGVDHCRQCHRVTPGRDLYACSAVHAEMNALLQCPDIYKIKAAYITINPCMICARLLANTSCTEVYFNEIYTLESSDEFTKFWDLRLKRNFIKILGNFD